MQQSLSDLLSMFPPKQDDLISTNHPSYLEHRRKADPAIHTNFSKLLNKVTYIFSIVQTQVNHSCLICKAANFQGWLSKYVRKTSQKGIQRASYTIYGKDKDVQASKIPVSHMQQ